MFLLGFMSIIWLDYVVVIFELYICSNNCSLFVGLFGCKAYVMKVRYAIEFELVLKIIG